MTEITSESSRPGSVEFIISSYSNDSSSGDLQRRARAHAARIAHAKARHLRTTKYQASTGMKTSQRSHEAKQEGNEIIGKGFSASDTIKSTEQIIFSPVGLLAADRRDPFDAFARQFEPIEHFLLDHCKSFEFLRRFEGYEICCFQWFALTSTLFD